jgi:putative ABC transport system permease protein
MFNLPRIAARNVVRNARRTLITLAALLLGVGVMVSIRGTVNGLQRSMKEGMVLGQTGALQIHRTGYMKNVLGSPLNLDFALDDALLKKIAAVPHVTAIAPRILFGGMVNLVPPDPKPGEEGGATLFMIAMALDPVQELKVCSRRGQLFDGPAQKFFQPGNQDGVVITAELAKALGGKLTGLAALLAPDKDGALSGENATLLGTMNMQTPGDRKIGVVPLALAQRLLKMDGRATELAVALDDFDRAEEVAAQLRTVLGQDFEVHVWLDIVTFFKDVMFNQNFMLTLIATVFMVLMLLGIANTMLMAVLDRTREIGTMMAVGVRRGKIVQLFLMEAAVIGALGGSVGGVVGALFVGWLNQRGITITLPTSTVPFVIRPYVTPAYLAGVVALAAAGAVVFAIYPAWRASRMRPVQALAGG